MIDILDLLKNCISILKDDSNFTISLNSVFCKILTPNKESCIIDENNFSMKIRAFHKSP